MAVELWCIDLAAGVDGPDRELLSAEERAQGD